MANETFSWTEGPRGRLRVRERAGGELPIVLVHGLGNHSGVWDDVVPRLPADLRVVRFDLQGFGESAPSPDGAYTVEAAARDVWAVIDALRLDGAILVGHSYGGAVIGAACGMHPDRVAGGLFVDAAVDTPRYEKVDLLREGMEPSRFRPFVERWYTGMAANAAPGVKERVFEMLWATSQEVFAATVRGLVEYDPKPALLRFRRPKWSVVGPTNAVIPQAIHCLDVGVIPREMLGVSHWLMMDRPDDFVGLVKAFVEAVRAFR